MDSIATFCSAGRKERSGWRVGQRGFNSHLKFVLVSTKYTVNLKGI